MSMTIISAMSTSRHGFGIFKAYGVSTTRFFPNAGLITISEKEVFSNNCDNSPHNGSVPLAFTANHLGCVKLIFGVDPDPENPEGDGTPENSASITICVTDPKIAVDENRDGNIDLVGDSDQTAEGKPYRFWVNDDDDTECLPKPDGSPSGVPLEAETVPSLVQDYQHHAIVSKRNLEDFTRLWINLDGMQNALVTGEIKAALKWKTVDSGLPATIIYPSKDGNGSLSYITDDDAAGLQVADVFGMAVTDANDQNTVNGTFTFKTDYWAGLDVTHPKKCLLFEGAGEGKGELALILYDRNGTHSGEGGSVWTDVKHIKRMYYRGKAQPESIVAPNESINGPFTGPMSYVEDPGGFPLDRDSSERKELFFSCTAGAWITGRILTLAKQCLSDFGGKDSKDGFAHSAGTRWS